MRAVVDAGPVIHLSWIDRLDLLDQLFEEVLLPPAVRDEILAPPPGTLGLDRIEKALAQGQLQVRELSGAPQLLGSSRPLGPGETAALLLSEESGADLLLTDDADARAEARRRGLRATGTVGLLGQARDEGLIPAVLPLILELGRLGQWIGDHLVEDVRRQEGGPP